MAECYGEQLSDAINRNAMQWRRRVNGERKELSSTKTDDTDTMGGWAMISLRLEGREGKSRLERQAACVVNLKLGRRFLTTCLFNRIPSLSSRCCDSRLRGRHGPPTCRSLAKSGPSVPAERPGTIGLIGSNGLGANTHANHQHRAPQSRVANEVQPLAVLECLNSHGIHLERSCLGSPASLLPNWVPTAPLLALSVAANVA